jgi:thiamine kinase-like enzyme
LSDLCNTALVPLADTGLAHWHVRLGGSGQLARIPKQSQMQLSASDNLAYQAACFERASGSGHTPRLHGALLPTADLPRGALIVEEIVGRPARLPGDLPAIMRALAAIHRGVVPEAGQRAPLRDAEDPLADLLAEVGAQATFIDEAQLDSDVRTTIEHEIATFAELVAAPTRPTKSLIAFDAHPGNFLIDTRGRAILVDLEKARYAYPPLDLAHATLYTSTTWDIASSVDLSQTEIVTAYAAWTASMGAFGSRWSAWHVPLRRAMWLWSVTWCAKWRVLSRLTSAQSGDGEDWSSDNSDRALADHVRDRIDHYLSRSIVERIQTEIAALGPALMTLHSSSVQPGSSE